MISKTQSGGVFFYILLAVAMIAALSYAVSSGNRASESTLTSEQARVAAQEIIEYANTITAAVQKLTLRGCSDTEISFENNISTDNYTNAGSPSDKSCHVFDIAGGNANYSLVSEHTSISGGYGYLEPMFKSGFQIEGNGTDATDLDLQINSLKRDVCIKINDLLGITNPSGEPPEDGNDTGNTTFIGAYGATRVDTIGDDAGSGLSGKSAFCRDSDATAGTFYQYNHVLITR